MKLRRSRHRSRRSVMGRNYSKTVLADVRIGEIISRSGHSAAGPLSAIQRRKSCSSRDINPTNAFEQLKRYSTSFRLLKANTRVAAASRTVVLGGYPSSSSLSPAHQPSRTRWIAHPFVLPRAPGRKFDLQQSHQLTFRRLARPLLPRMGHEHQLHRYWRW